MESSVIANSHPILREFSFNNIIRSNFTNLLFFMSMIGFFIIPVTASIYWPFKQTIDLYHFIIYVSGAHIGFTYFFYFDKEAKSLRNEQWVRFYLIPLPVMLLIFYIFLHADAVTEKYLWQAIGIWTIWHFQKQNFGVFTFICIDKGLKTASKLEKSMILGSGLVACAANLLNYGKGIEGTLFDSFRHTIFSVSSFCFVLIFLLLIGTMIWNRINCKTSIFTQRNFALALFVLYFWPLFIVKNANVAFMMFAVGHGLQYILFLSIIASDGKNRILFRFPFIISALRFPFLRNLRSSSIIFFQLLFLFCLSFAIFAGTNYLSNLKVEEFLGFNLGKGLIGLAFSVTAVHYILDAGIWRLTKPIPRSYAKKNFDFIFSSKNSSG